MSRLEKVNELIKQETSKAIKEVSEPEMGFVTVLSAEVTKDLRKAIVKVSIFGGKSENDFELLKKKTKEIQRIIGQNISMKYTPIIDFKLDTAGEYVQRIEEKLREIKENGK